MNISISKIKYLHFWILIIYFSSTKAVNAAFLDWIWPQSKSPDTFTRTEGPMISVPFEYKTQDEKFIEEASKFTDLMKTSSLDICQHKVILQIKTSCFSMSEEELAKLSVNLLNCQSEVDERKIFPCTESMTLKECTKDMDANMWNAYHLMNNRARAVCLAARQAQFQALSEMTVNKLMSTAHDQINKMGLILEEQDKLESLTLGTLDSVEKGHVKLMEQQENLKSAQKIVQDFVTFNLEQLTQEKALIAAGNKELAKMTETIKEKLDEANQQLKNQSEERAENHEKLVVDIEALQKQARSIFQRIDSSTEKLLAQHEVASMRYKDAVENLIKINDTVHYLLKILNSTRNEIDERFYWIQDFLDGTGNNIEKLSSITFHIAYLLIGMLFASFLNFSSTSRAVLTAIVPLNLYVTCNKGSEMAMDFLQMTVLLLIIVLVITIIHQIQKYFSERSSIHNYERITHNSNPQEYDRNNSREKARKQTPVTVNSPLQYFNRFFNKINYSLSQLLSFAFGWVGKKTSQSYQLKANKSDENLISSSMLGERNNYLNNLNNWHDYSPVRDRYEQSVHTRVNEWLQNKVDYTPRAGSASSSTSGTPKFQCSATCRSGRRCKNLSSPGRDICHVHLTGTSIAS